MEYNNLLIFMGILLIIIPLIVRSIKKHKNRRFQLLRLKNMAGSISDYEQAIYMKMRAKRTRPSLRIRIKKWANNITTQIKTDINYNWNLFLSFFKKEKKENKERQYRPVLTKADMKYTPPVLITGEDKFTDSGKPLTAPPEQD